MQKVMVDEQMKRNPSDQDEKIQLIETGSR